MTERHETVRHVGTDEASTARHQGIRTSSSSSGTARRRIRGGREGKGDTRTRASAGFWCSGRQAARRPPAASRARPRASRRARRDGAPRRPRERADATGNHRSRGRARRRAPARVRALARDDGPRLAVREPSRRSAGAPAAITAVLAPSAQQQSAGQRRRPSRSRHAWWRATRVRPRAVPVPGTQRHAAPRASDRSRAADGRARRGRVGSPWRRSRRARLRRAGTHERSVPRRWSASHAQPSANARDRRGGERAAVAVRSGVTGRPPRRGGGRRRLGGERSSRARARHSTRSAARADAARSCRGRARRRRARRSWCRCAPSLGELQVVTGLRVEHECLDGEARPRQATARARIGGRGARGVHVLDEQDAHWGTQQCLVRAVAPSCSRRGPGARAPGARRNLETAPDGAWGAGTGRTRRAPDPWSGSAVHRPDEAARPLEGGRGLGGPAFRLHPAHPRREAQPLQYPSRSPARPAPWARPSRRGRDGQRGGLGRVNPRPPPARGRGHGPKAPRASLQA